VLSGDNVVQFTRVLTEMLFNPASTVAIATSIPTIRLFIAPFQRASARFGKRVNYAEARRSVAISDRGADTALEKKRRAWTKRPPKAFSL
jgi:hypothetical protein